MNAQQMADNWIKQYKINKELFGNLEHYICAAEASLESSETFLTRATEALDEKTALNCVTNNIALRIFINYLNSLKTRRAKS